RAGTYLQYHYIVENRNEGPDRSQLIEADGDTSAYGRVHRQRQARLDRLRAMLGFDDLLLVDAEGTIVYSAAKRFDFGTSLVRGPYRESGLARLVTRRLAAAPVGDAVFSDFELYLPASARPTMFVAAALRSGTETIGAVAFSIPIESLNRLVTSDRRWEDVGLGRTGDIYVVGADRLMRSEPRLWIEDRDAYLSDLDESGLHPTLSETITALDTPVLVQPVDTDSVNEALNGGTFTGSTRDYLARSTLAFAAPVGAEGLDWVIVAEVPMAEAGESLRMFRTRLLVTGGLLVPLVWLLGVALARRMTRPVHPVLAAAVAIAGGDLEATAPDLGRNEFGDVARRLNVVASDLRGQRQALEEEERQITRLLLSALPPRLVEQLRSGRRQIADLIDSATVITMTIEGAFDQAGIDPDAAVELGSRLSADLEAAAERLGIERVRSSSSQHLFVAGLDSPNTEADQAAEFVIQARDLIDRFAEDRGVAITYHAGLAAGEVLAGLLAGDQLTFGVVGEPAQIALTLDAAAVAGQVLVHRSVVDDLSDRWVLEALSNLTDLRGQQIDAFALTGVKGGVSPQGRAPSIS
ncbi:MAG: HAMP domain-containing protein, partial [Acidimicrobiia bacterium]|nr:HAMP domain-containing protein [Acidimicrobiia bacterium]